jgi:predicted transglutaminase-like cysteine proteinase
MFGYNELDQPDLSILPQWTRVIKRHPREDFDSTNIQLKEWLAFVNSLRMLPPREQIEKVNSFANERKYIVDLRNYGVKDYWAIVKEFLHNFGDCEDFSITKFYSLRLLGFNEDDLRVLILQDTNLGVAHAVLAVALDGDVLILDNQSQQVISHHEIVHYTPLYSVNEQQWWLHLPPNL